MFLYRAQFISKENEMEALNSSAYVSAVKSFVNAFQEKSIESIQNFNASFADFFDGRLFYKTLLLLIRTKPHSSESLGFTDAMGQDLLQYWKIVAENTNGLSHQIFPILTQSDSITISSNIPTDTIVAERKLIPIHSPLVDQILKDIKVSEVFNIIYLFTHLLV